MSTTSPAAPVRPTPAARGPLPDGKWLLPVDDAAAILGMSERTLRRQIAAETIPHRRNNGRVWMLWPDDVQAAIDDMFVDPTYDD